MDISQTWGLISQTRGLISQTRGLISQTRGLISQTRGLISQSRETISQSSIQKCLSASLQSSHFQVNTSTTSLKLQLSTLNKKQTHINE
ncbi:hypothetical protein AAHH67_05340 [Niallia circulans]